MTISPEQLKSLTTPQLLNLEKVFLILSQWEHNATCDFDKLLEQIRAPQSALSQTDTDLIRARSYELTIYEPYLDPERARAQAMQEFKAGKLHHPEQKRQIIPRYKPRETDAGNAAANLGPPVAPARNNAPASLAQPSAKASKAAPDPLPPNTVKAPTALNDDTFYGKCFYSLRQQDEIW